MRWAEHLARIREKRNLYRLFVGKPEGKKLLEIKRPMWVDNIKMDLEAGLVCTRLVWLTIRRSGELS
jgi:hypothetical protein